MALLHSQDPTTLVPAFIIFVRQVTMVFSDLAVQ